MQRMVAAWLLGLVVVIPLCAQETAFPGVVSAACADQQLCPDSQIIPGSVVEGATVDEGSQAQEPPWQAAWGLAGIHFIPKGPKTAPNGLEYHPNFSLDLDLNIWLWRNQRLYLYADARFWGERSEFGVTNSRDGFFGTSKRQFDLSGGAAWNYLGPLEARFFGYSMNNLNRGSDQVRPSGFNDGSALENRYYLSSEYTRLGQTGYDVARATFVSVG
jgi:hypothetical protein